MWAGVQGHPVPPGTLFCFQTGAAGDQAWREAPLSAALALRGWTCRALQGQVRTTAAGLPLPRPCACGQGQGEWLGQAVKEKWAWGQGPAHPLSRQAGGACLEPWLVCGPSHLLRPSTCDLPQTRPSQGAPLGSRKTGSPIPARPPPACPGISLLSTSIWNPAVWPGDPLTVPTQAGDLPPPEGLAGWTAEILWSHSPHPECRLISLPPGSSGTLLQEAFPWCTRPVRSTPVEWTGRANCRPKSAGGLGLPHRTRRQVSSP